MHQSQAQAEPGRESHETAPHETTFLSDNIATHQTHVDGHDMFSLRAGTGYPLLLLHGLLGTAVRWRNAIESILAESPYHHAEIHAVDALGMGESDRVPGLNSSLRASAARLLQYMDAEGIERADLCGTSHGGAVAMFFAAIHPERVRSLILQGPANPFCQQSRPQIRFFSSRLGRWLAQFIPHAPRRLQNIALVPMYGDPLKIRTEALEEYVQSLQVPGTINYVLSVIARWTTDMAELRSLLPKLRSMPCLLLWGTHDRAVSLSSAERLSHVLGADLELMPGVGHLAYEEVPDEFAARVCGFLAQQLV